MVAQLVEHELPKLRVEGSNPFRRFRVDVPLHIAATVCASVAFLCWALSVVTREYSCVDRIWSILPPVYVGIFAQHRHFDDARLNLMFALTAAWGARLTFNFARKGGYAKGGEDYRWAVLRERIKGVKWQAFNFFFIAGYQNFLIALLALPAWAVSEVPATPLAAGDYALAAAFLACLALETVADQQQWNFHQEKKRRLAAGDTNGSRFLTTGLFAYSRHPNFFFEQAQWWLLAGFVPLAGGDTVGLWLGGPFLLTLLFLGSTRFTESISASKYPEYANYQRRVSALIPWIPHGPPRITRRAPGAS